MEQQAASVQRAIEDILSAIIDDWYQNISAYYVTPEQLSENKNLNVPEELKRFHDQKGHRIKFNKGDLDFTYGLRSLWENNDFIIEISVNNKVENFNYSDFEDRLLAYYRKTGEEKAPTPRELRNFSFSAIFKLQPGIKEAFKVERRGDKADIMRLSFCVDDRHLEELASHPVAGKELIERYCVSPFRSVYATVYRSSPR
ncbi:MAG: hypothetical protein ACRD1R_13820 [Acidobacteriota bacterium]